MAWFCLLVSPKPCSLLPVPYLCVSIHSLYILSTLSGKCSPQENTPSGTMTRSFVFESTRFRNIYHRKPGSVLLRTQLAQGCNPQLCLRLTLKLLLQVRWAQWQSSQPLGHWSREGPFTLGRMGLPYLQMSADFAWGPQRTRGFHVLLGEFWFSGMIWEPFPTPHSWGFCVRR